MKRRLVTLAAVASLLLCVATVALWVRSYWRNDSVILSVRGFSFCANSNCGRISLVWVTTYLSTPLFTTTPARTPEWPHTAFGTTSDRHVGEDFRTVWFPIWPLTIAGGALTSLAVATSTRHGSRQNRHLCRDCGYDLRATPDRCPECGGVPAAR